MDSDQARLGRLLAWITVSVMIVAPTLAIVAKTLGAPMARWPSPFGQLMGAAIALGCSAPLWGSIVASLLGRPRRQVELKAQEDGLQINGRLVPYAEISAAAEVPVDSRPAMVIADRRGDVHSFRAPLVALRGVLEKVRKRTAGGRLALPLETMVRKFVRVLWAVAGLGLVGTTLSRFAGSPLDPGIFLVVFSLLGAVFTARQLRYEEIVVGDDGVRLPKRRGLPRFVPHRAIRDIEQKGEELRLRLNNGKSIPLPTTRMSRMRRGMLREILHERKGGGRKADEVDSLTRAGDVRSWIARVREFLTQRDGFRTPAVDEKKVAEVLSDGEATVEERVGAALALLAQDTANAPRVRVAIDQSADVRLEAALEAVLEGDDQELQKVLEEA